MGRNDVALSERGVTCSCLTLVWLAGVGGCVTQQATPQAPPPPTATPPPVPLVFGPTPDEQMRQLQTRVEVLTDRVNDIYLRQVQMEQRL
jgi:ABC-type phosphate/phosphonate transport system substrate-binding protein